MQHVKFITWNKIENTKTWTVWNHSYNTTTQNIAAAFTWLIVFVWILYSNRFTLVNLTTSSKYETRKLYSMMSQLHHIITRPLTSLGHQEGRRFFWEGPKFFELCPIVSNYIKHSFPGGAKKFLGVFAPLVTGLIITTKQFAAANWWSTTSNNDNFTVLHQRCMIIKKGNHNCFN